MEAGDVPDVLLDHLDTRLGCHHGAWDAQAQGGLSESLACRHEVFLIHRDRGLGVVADERGAIVLPHDLKDLGKRRDVVVRRHHAIQLRDAHAGYGRKNCPAGPH